MKKRKIIVLSQRVDVIEEYGEIRDALDQKWSEFVFRLGYSPIALPNFPESAEECLEALKPEGIFLTGGSGPVEYGGNSEKRDKIDEILIKYAIKEDVPLIGICRGMQSVGCYFGNELKQVTGHVATKHLIKGDEPRLVNSFHNWGFQQINQQEFYIHGRSEDSCIEFIQHKKYRISGIMWHPERNNPFEIEDIQLIQRLLR